jgi:hypothetical protein
VFKKDKGKNSYYSKLITREHIVLKSQELEALDFVELKAKVIN